MTEYIITKGLGQSYYVEELETGKIVYQSQMLWMATAESCRLNGYSITDDYVDYVQSIPPLINPSLFFPIMKAAIGTTWVVIILVLLTVFLPRIIGT